MSKVAVPFMAINISSSSKCACPPRTDPGVAVTRYDLWGTNGSEENSNGTNVPRGSICSGNSIISYFFTWGE